MDRAEGPALKAIGWRRSWHEHIAPMVSAHRCRHPAQPLIYRRCTRSIGVRAVALIASETEDAMAESELFERGLQRRREVLGSEYVDANLRDSDELMMAFQRAVSEVAWGIPYCGTPAGRQAFLAAHRALSAEGALG